MPPRWPLPEYRAAPDLAYLVSGVHEASSMGLRNKPASALPNICRFSILIQFDVALDRAGTPGQ